MLDLTQEVLREEGLQDARVFHVHVLTELELLDPRALVLHLYLHDNVEEGLASVLVLIETIDPIDQIDCLILLGDQ